MEKISKGNNNNEIGINKIVNGFKEVMAAGDVVNEANNLDASESSNCADRSNAAT